MRLSRFARPFPLNVFFVTTFLFDPSPVKFTLGNMVKNGNKCMATLLAIFFALFVFAMSTTGVITAVGTPDIAQYDIKAAAQLLKTIYVQPFGVPDFASGPVSLFLLALPSVLAFFIIQTMFTRKR
jgi:hypothetical protein